MYSSAVLEPLVDSRQSPLRASPSNTANLTLVLFALIASSIANPYAAGK